MESAIYHYNNTEESSDEELEDNSWMNLLEEEEKDYKSFYKENIDVIKLFLHMLMAITKYIMLKKIIY